MNEVLKDPKYALEPIGKEEKRIWFHLEMQGDKPIINIVKRLNKIFALKFPQYSLYTEDTCSGHINEDRTLNYEIHDYMPNTMVLPRTPHIMLIMTLSTENYDQEMTEIRSFLDPIFEQAVAKVNTEFAADGLKLDIRERKGELYEQEDGSTHRDSDGLTYRVDVLIRKKAVFSIPAFWKHVEESLCEIDGLKIPSEITEESFVRQPDPKIPGARSYPYTIPEDE